MKVYSLDMKLSVRSFDLDPYNIVHHSCYFTWIDMSQRQCLSNYMSEWFLQHNLNITDGIVKKFNCKYMMSALSGMDIIIKTILHNKEQMADGVVFYFRHFVTCEQTNQKLACSDTEIYFSY